MPIGAFVSSYEKMKLLSHDPILGHITTFGGHPAVCAAGAACLDVMKNEINYEQIEEKGQYIENQLSKHPKIKEIRRVGLMFAIDMESDEIVAEVVKNCLEEGLISFWFLSHPNSFRLSPPLNISWEEVKESVRIILKSLG